MMPRQRKVIKQFRPDDLVLQFIQKLGNISIYTTAVHILTGLKNTTFGTGRELSQMKLMP